MKIEFYIYRRENNPPRWERDGIGRKTLDEARELVKEWKNGESMKRCYKIKKITEEWMTLK